MAATDNIKLEQRLILAAWACEMLGWKPPSNKPRQPMMAEMLAHLRDVREGYDPKGGSPLVQALLSHSGCQIPKNDLERYDANIQSYLTGINHKRKDPITLRYFQHLSLLATELFLDWRFNHPVKLRAALNELVEWRHDGEPQFSEKDMDKLAFWMATGSGKTILMHFHYRQYLHYCKKEPDNILLITPDSGLTQQHLEQMEKAGIPCGRFSLEDSGFEPVKKNAVRVIEITKLVGEKKGSGVSVPVEAFEGNNLIFVDEGHKGAGSGGGAWMGYRAKLAETGFTFEYSATFGQAMVGDDSLTREYGKAILFDYSYKYFYGDGFGKEFEVLNLRLKSIPKTESPQEKQLRQARDQDQAQMLLLGNLLSFYEQKRAYHTRTEVMLRYHLADPLWIFVGSTVNKSKTNKQANDSDVLTVVQFLDVFLRNEKSWVQKSIQRILDGKSGLETEDSGTDLFAGRFATLKSLTASAIHDAILAQVFHAGSGGGLHVSDIKGRAGELGLKVSSSDHYFGLIYIGDTSGFKALIEERCAEVTVEEDQISESLFENIKRPDSRINILIGAKKFMQGWDSWRVTNMGLLNIGRSEGTEIIQLFGRGVRLLGQDRSLKRSSALTGNHPKSVRLLEKLNIFAIRANYMAQFRDYLEREGIEPAGEIEMELPIKQNPEFLKKGLLVPRLPPEANFLQEQRFVLEMEAHAAVTLDLTVQVESIGSKEGRYTNTTFRSGTQRWVNPDFLRLLDMEAIYLEMIGHKEAKGYHNLIVRPEHPGQILGANFPKMYHLLCDEVLTTPTSAQGLRRLQDVLTGVVKKYLETFYKLRQQQWENGHMVYAVLTDKDPNFKNYTVRVPRRDEALQKTIQSIITEGKRIYKELRSDLPGVYFDQHLYQPLLIQKGSQVKTAPPGLNGGEQKFVENLRDWCLTKPKELEGKELFLLRNLSRGHGIGFFENSGFYPDFILWVVEGKKQRLVFVEPHGMIHEGHPAANSKVNLHTKLKAQAADVLKRGKVTNLELDAFVISETCFEELRFNVADENGPWKIEQFEAAHILFAEEDGSFGHLEKIVGSDVAER